MFALCSDALRIMPGRGQHIRMLNMSSWPMVRCVASSAESNFLASGLHTSRSEGGWPNWISD